MTYGENVRHVKKGVKRAERDSCAGKGLFADLGKQKDNKAAHRFTLRCAVFAKGGNVP